MGFIWDELQDGMIVKLISMDPLDTRYNLRELLVGEHYVVIKEHVVERIFDMPALKILDPTQLPKSLCKPMVFVMGTGFKVEILTEINNN